MNRVATLLGIVAIALPVSFWAYRVDAETKKVPTLEEIARGLARLHEDENVKKRAEEETNRKHCAAKRLSEKECAELGFKWGWD